MLGPKSEQKSGKLLEHDDLSGQMLLLNSSITAVVKEATKQGTKCFLYL